VSTVTRRTWAWTIRFRCFWLVPSLAASAHWDQPIAQRARSRRAVPHRGMQKALAPLSAYGGNLIVTLDFSRWWAKYYKVTEKVDAEDLGPGVWRHASRGGSWC
jgi:hypothetical protein